MRVQLAAWILGRDGERFFLSEVQTAMATTFGSAGSAVRDEIRAFEQWGMLASARDGVRLYYNPQPHDLWNVFRLIAEAVDGLTET